MESKSQVDLFSFQIVIAFAQTSLEIKISLFIFKFRVTNIELFIAVHSATIYNFQKNYNSCSLLVKCRISLLPSFGTEFRLSFFIVGIVIFNV